MQSPSPRTLRITLFALAIAVTQLAGPRMRDVYAEDRAQGAASAPIRVAVTFDDLPWSGETLPEWPADRLVTALAATLARHHVPEAVGFFTGGNLDGRASTVTALQAWCAAGHLLANHSFAHVGADLVDADSFLADVAHNQALLEELVPPRCLGGRYFRFPGLMRGRGAAGRRIREGLMRAGLTVADVSLDNADWALTDAFVRCRRSGDERAERAVVSTFLEHAEAELAWSVDTAERLWGRAVPHVLLLHANALTAERLDALLSGYEALGVVFVPLREALADPAYVERDTAAARDGKLLEAALADRGLSRRRFLPEPLALIDALCPEGDEPHGEDRLR